HTFDKRLADGTTTSPVHKSLALPTSDHNSKRTFCTLTRSMLQQRLRNKLEAAVAAILHAVWPWANCELWSDGLMAMITQAGNCYTLSKCILCACGTFVSSPPLTRLLCSLKEEMARFLTDYCRAPAPLDPENMESGETYPFQLTVPKLEAALTSAQDKEICVRGLILINPHNPLGDIYPADDLMSYLQFAKRHKLHVIMDEIYMLTIFKEGVEFTSVLSFDCLPDPSRTHVMWSLSKDFAASGLRIGVLYTCNSEVIQALGKIAYVHGVPGPLQSSVAQLLRDREWIDSEFLPTNRARLLAAHTYMAGRLRSMGVPYLDRASGLYIWANFQQFLKEPTFEAEVELWRALIQAKVLIGHGQAFLCPEPGWVRLVFSEKQQSLHLGMTSCCIPFRNSSVEQ
uniref:Aminotransferase class I/classII large domain-containing protein n=1 Tax=Eptatretus burgeri TaxID=7764 RepID=A0A8C4QY19_EPTBU